MNKILILVIPILFSGCMAIFNIGHDKGICESRGCDYSNAGVCGDSYEIYKNWKKALYTTYKNIGCKGGEK